MSLRRNSGDVWLGGLKPPSRGRRDRCNRPSRRVDPNGSPIGLSARRRVDDVNGRRDVVSEGHAFAAANGFQKARRPVRCLFRTSGGDLLNASNDGLCGSLGGSRRGSSVATGAACCGFCGRFGKRSAMRSRTGRSRRAAARSARDLEGSDSSDRPLAPAVDEGPS